MNQSLRRSRGVPRLERVHRPATPTKPREWHGEPKSEEKKIGRKGARGLSLHGAGRSVPYRAINFHPFP